MEVAAVAGSTNVLLFGDALAALVPRTVVNLGRRLRSMQTSQEQTLLPVVHPLPVCHSGNTHTSSGIFSETLTHAD